jgi:hypothetical protein
MGLIRDVLDGELVDRNQRRLGKVDGIIAELRPGQPPLLKWIESGWPVKARRLHPRLGEWMARRFPVHRIAWDKIRDIGVDTEVECDEACRHLMDSEKKLRRILTRIPGS